LLTNASFVHGDMARGSGFYRSKGKRAADLVLAVLMLAALGPLIVVLAGLVALDGGVPFFAHERIGRGGRRFRCWKIRTMVTDADARLRHLLETDPAARAEWGTRRKLTDDPRVTMLGRFLRETSLDELPQLYNVLRGDMSLVGPRPITGDELPLYGEGVNAYFELRPALTGLWQVGGRNDLDYCDRARLDLEYSHAITFTRDLLILVATVRAVLARTGC
jgi:lipopolysaccharide/colanic/teichoic acid biosynthesis glycosyltransferase